VYHVRLTNGAAGFDDANSPSGAEPPPLPLAGATRLGYLSYHGRV